MIDVGRRSAVRGGMAAFLSMAIVAGTASSSFAYRRPGTLSVVDVGYGGTQATDLPIQSYHCGGGYQGPPSITPDGRYVAFASVAGNLVRGDVNASADIFVRDIRRETTKVASVNSNGDIAINPDPRSAYCTGTGNASLGPSISANGRYVVFTSEAVNLVPGDTNNFWDVFLHDMHTGKTTRVSVSSSGAQARVSPGTNSAPPTASISADGRYVAFRYPGTGLATGDDRSGIYTGIYVRDLKTKKTRYISASSNVAEYYPFAGPPSLSANGRYIYFYGCLASHCGQTAVVDPAPLGPALYDQRTGKITAVVSGSSRVQSGWAFGWQTISASGRFLIMGGTQRVPNEQERGGFGLEDENVYVYDRQTGRVQRISVNSNGEEANNQSPASIASISPNGRYVAFTSRAGNLTPDPDQGQGRPCTENVDPTHTSCDLDVFIYDRLTGATERLSLTPRGAEAACPSGPETAVTGADSDTSGCASGWPSAPTNDGRYVAFWGDAKNFATAPRSSSDSNLMPDIFLRDRGLELGAGGFEGGGSSGSAGGTCVSNVCVPPCVQDVCPAPTVASQASDPASDVSTALAHEGADLIGASIAIRPELGDLFVRALVSHMPTISGTPTAGSPLLYGLDFTANGAHYEVRVQRVLGPDYDAAGGASFGLFEQDAVTGLYTDEIASLRGGYGTTGDEVVFSLPTKSIGLRDGGTLRRLRAFIALGTYSTGPASVLDTVRLGET